MIATRCARYTHIVRARLRALAWAAASALILPDAMGAPGPTIALTGTKLRMAPAAFVAAAGRQAPPVATLDRASPTRVVSVSGTADAFYAAARAVPVDTWIQGTSFGTVQTFYDLSVAKGYIEHGQGGQALCTPWSGGALRQPDGILYITGGGHLDGGWNGLGAISLESGAASLPVMPSIVTNAQHQAIVDSWNLHGGWLGFSNYGIHPSSDPRTAGATRGPPFGATHTYGMFFVHGDEVFVNQNKLYDVATGTATAVGGVGQSDTDGCTGPDGKFYTLSASGQYAVTQVDLAATPRTTDGTPPTTIVEYMDYPYSPGQGANIDFDSFTYACVIGSKLFIVKVSSDGNPDYAPPLAWTMKVPLMAGRRNNTTVITSGLTGKWSAADMALVQKNTQAFDDVNNVLYIPARDWSFFLTWKPLTGEMGKVVMKNAGPSPQANAAYGRFGFYGKRQVFYLVNEWNKPPYFFRTR